MMYERRLMLREEPGRTGKSLFIYTLAGDKVRYETQDGDTITEHEAGRGEMIKRTLWFADEDLQLLADELQRLNIKPREASKTEGLLEAQSSHLADLRTLLKLK